MGTVDGFQERPEDRRWISITYVAPRYFETLGIPLLVGRGFRFEDEAQPNVAIINQTFARYYFADRNPIGKHVTLEHVTGVAQARSYEIVGVSGDATYMDIREPARRAIYLPAFRTGRVVAQNLLIRTKINPEGMAADVSRTVAAVLPGIPIVWMITLADQIDASIVPERLVATLSGFFAALGALLAGIGLYGLLAYTVARRTNEIGIRIALGATPRDVTWLILRDALATVTAGLILGVPMVIFGQSIALSIIPGVVIPAATPFAIATLGIIMVALFAAYLPARCAARIEPLEAVRHE